MSKDQKSMDEVLASIRKIIRTDPTAAPPDIGTAPGAGAGVGDETAREVLEKLRRQNAGDNRQPGAPLSTSDDPDEAARAVLDHLRQQAEAEAKTELKRPPAPAGEEPAPELEPTPDEPPVVAADADDVPEVEEPGPAEGALELGEDAGRRVMEPKRPPAPEPELPQPAGQGERREREAPVMVDEAALEAMIRRVVRDELMGEMGRRVTQNVVKLIRQEVARSRIGEK